MQPIIGNLSFLAIYAYFIIPLGPIVYIFNKWRSYRDAALPDPQLGMKTVLYYFKTLAYHVLLIGAAILPAGQITEGIGFLISGGVIYAIYIHLIYKFTNAREFPLTARIYNAFNVIITGLISMIAFIYAVTHLFGRWGPGFKLSLGIFVVYTAAWFFQIDCYLKISLVKKIFSSSSGKD